MRVISFVFLLPLVQLTAFAQSVTWSEQIAPIIYGNCSQCHHAGQVTPFTLMSYEDVAKHGPTVASVTQSRFMPPWKPETGWVAFRDERHLTADQISLIQQWVAAGMPQGDLSKAPAAPTYPDGWRLGTPDLILKMPTGFAVPADGPDIYRNFVLPTGLVGDRWVRAIELRPSAQSAVHHVLFYTDGSGQARGLDGQDGQPGFPGFGSVFTLGLPNPITFAGLLSLLQANNPVLATALAGGLGGWVPGTTPEFLPTGIAYSLPQGADLILQTHFHPDGKPETEQTTIGLYFTDKPLREITQIQAPSFFGIRASIDIPAGKPDYMVRGSFTLPVAVDAFSVSAHAHYLGKGTRMTATLPGSGEVKILLAIDDWNFSWQDSYIFKDLVTLPAGTRIDGELIYDNSADNPNNPFYPPKNVKWGENSTDEMGSLILNVVPHVATDTDPLRKAIEAYVFAGDPTFGDHPQLIGAGVVNAGSAQTGAVSPGEIVSLYGSQFGAAGTEVLFDKIPAPVVYASGTQVNAVVPYEVDGQPGTQVTVRNGTLVSAPVALPVTASSPGIFAVVDQDKPFAKGSAIVIYGTGEGQTNPGGVDGQIANGPVYAAPMLPVSVTVGGVPAVVKYAGAAPTLIAGVLQVNAEIPDGVAPGSAVVQLKVGSAVSQGITITVK